MTGRRILLTLVLLCGLTVQANAAPLIVQVGPLSNILSIVAALDGSVVDSIPGTNIFLLNVPFLPSSFTASLLGIQWMETNQGVALPSISVLPFSAFPPIRHRIGTDTSHR